MNWQKLENIEELDNINTISQNQDVLIFKHSTRCSISATVLSRLERHWDDKIKIVPFYLDLIKFRHISDQIAHDFSLRHESPQVLLIRKGNCIYNASHFDIEFEEIAKI